MLKASLRQRAKEPRAMTEILEIRWKCNFCDIVSPVLDEIPNRPVERVTPVGWTRVPDDYISLEDKHFCCKAHEVLWKQQQEKETA